jgi:predicted transcriptional regulator
MQLSNIPRDDRLTFEAYLGYIDIDAAEIAEPLGRASAELRSAARSFVSQAHQIRRRWRSGTAADERRCISRARRLIRLADQVEQKFDAIVSG